MTFLPLCGFGLNFLIRRHIIIVHFVLFTIATCYLGLHRQPPHHRPPLAAHALDSPPLLVGAGALAAAAMAEGGGGARAAPAMPEGGGALAAATMAEGGALWSWPQWRECKVL